MMALRQCAFIFSLLLLSFHHLNANPLSVTDDNRDIFVSDTIPAIRSLFERENNTYSRPFPIAELQKQEESSRISDEALYWSRNRMSPADYFPGYIGFRDTVVPQPFLLTPIFSKDLLDEEFDLIDPDKYTYKPKKRAIWDYPAQPKLFEKEMQRKGLRRKAYRKIFHENPSAFRYTRDDLPDDVIPIQVIRKDPRRGLPVVNTPEVNLDEMAPPAKFIPDRMYWTSQFESAIQFSQNHVTPNWHKGGSSNLNIFTVNSLKYNFEKEKVQFTNLLESKASIYNATKDTIHRYKIGEDLLRLYSNFGYKAYNNWYYTYDMEFKTQLFKSYGENSELQQAGFLAPYTVNMGIGMKYDLNKEFEAPGKNLKLSVNIAPASYTYMYSRKKDIDLGRHGFEKRDDSDEYYNYLSQFGSALRADMTMNFSHNISWQSRIYYFTTYENVLAEFENTVILAITRHFSTRIYLHVRFDDKVTKTEDFDSYFQVNELLSFGFNYKW